MIEQNERRSSILAEIEQERVRQFNLPGSEWDSRNGPNDWVAIATHYLGEEVRRSGNVPDRNAYERSLIKAAAIIVSALEHIDIMVKNETLVSDFDQKTGALMFYDNDDK